MAQAAPGWSIPTNVGKYRIDGPLGSGGIGMVFKA
jgi:hypothetical protein